MKKDGKKPVKKKKPPTKKKVDVASVNLDKTPFDLVVAIVNKGYTDLVMNATRKAGAKGGTIAIARGTSNRELADFYGIALQPEKEVVFIVVPRAISDQVLKEVYDEAGLSTKGQGIVFALPAGYTVGLEQQALLAKATVKD